MNTVISPAETLQIDQLLTPLGRQHWPQLARHIGRYVRAAAEIGISAGDVVLDASCGQGYGAAWLCSLGCTVVGLDINRDHLACARALWGETSALRFRPYTQDTGEMPDEADAIVSIETIEHVQRDVQRTWWTSLTHRLRPGGRAVIICPRGGDEPSRSNPWHLSEPSPETLLQLAAGFAHAQLQTGHDGAAASLCLTLRGWKQ